MSAAERPIARLLARLDAVRQTGEGQWVARCPAHEDRTPSLGILEKPDGVLLVLCRGGCETSDVMRAVGLSLADLYPRRARDHRARGDGGAWVREQRIADARASAARDAAYVLIVSEALAAGETLTPAERDALASAAGRLRLAADRLWEAEKNGGAK